MGNIQKYEGAGYQIEMRFTHRKDLDRALTREEFNNNILSMEIVKEISDNILSVAGPVLDKKGDDYKSIVTDINNYTAGQVTELQTYITNKTNNISDRIKQIQERLTNIENHLDSSSGSSSN